MRTVSFSHPKLQQALNEDFVATFTNTTGDESAGQSFSHAPSDSPGPCGFAAGRQNVQVLFMTNAGQIFHVVSGFRTGEELLEEMKYANDLFRQLRRAQDPEHVVTETHHRRLAHLGYSANEIRSGNIGLLGRNNPVDFMPQDLGVPMAPIAGSMFDDVVRQRPLTDHKYVAENPLISKSAFERHPELLVGEHDSFFGSHEALNGLEGAVDVFDGHRPGIRLK